MFEPLSLTETELRSALEAAGRRCTRQRLQVYQVLARQDQHPTADEIFQQVRADLPKISLATVYNALEALVDSGLAAKITSGHGSARYDARRDHHYHLRCLSSGEVLDLPTPYDPELIAKLDPRLPDLLRRMGFHLTGYRLELVGHFDSVPGSSNVHDTPSDS